jgi:hypothetical protein
MKLPIIDLCLKKVFEKPTLSRDAPRLSLVNSAFQSAQIRKHEYTRN